MSSSLDTTSARQCHRWHLSDVTLLPHAAFEYFNHTRFGAWSGKKISDLTHTKGCKRAEALLKSARCVAGRFFSSPLLKVFAHGFTRGALWGGGTGLTFATGFIAGQGYDDKTLYAGFCEQKLHRQGNFISAAITSPTVGIHCPSYSPNYPSFLHGITNTSTSLLAGDYSVEAANYLRIVPAFVMMVGGAIVGGLGKGTWDVVSRLWFSNDKSGASTVICPPPCDEKTPPPDDTTPPSAEIKRDDKKTEKKEQKVAPGVAFDPPPSNAATPISTAIPLTNDKGGDKDKTIQGAPQSDKLKSSEKIDEKK